MTARDYLTDPLELSAQRAAAQRASTLPADPTLTADAQALRARFSTPMERLNGFANGIYEYADPAGVRADIALLSYFHKQQTNAMRIETDASALHDTVVSALRTLARPERDALEAALAAQHAVRKAAASAAATPAEGDVPSA